MKTSILFVTMSLIMTLCSCANNTNGNYDKYFEREKAIDLSDVLKVYYENKKAETDSTEYDLGKALEGRVVEDYDGIQLYDDNGFVIALPQYAHSNHPFLSRAEDFYNSCLLAFNVWNDYEILVRELASAEEASKAINGINADCIKNTDVRMAAKMYKDSVILMMQIPSEQDSGEMTPLLSYSEKIESMAYKYFENEEAFVDSLDALTTELVEKTKTQFNLYKQSDANNRLELMLHTLNECRTFDEQCSLLLNWANCEESETEDAWIVAVAGRLIRAGKYNPCLNNVWIVWRCLFQSEYYGISRDSSIPNDNYNKMRQLCYITCLKRIEQHPDDVFAINCAAAVGGRVNINRFGEFPFGNEAPTETLYSLPKRYSDDEGDNDISSSDSSSQDSIE